MNFFSTYFRAAHFRALRFNTPQCARLLFVVASLAFFAIDIHAATIRGAVTDPLGAVVTNAKVELLSGNETVDSTTTDGQGKYSFQTPGAGRFRVRVAAATFAATDSDAFYASAKDTITQNVLLQPANISQEIVVTATGVPTSEAQVGASVSVLVPQSFPDHLDVLNFLESAPGLQLTQTTGHGGTAQLFTRGGDSNANKVLLDGVPVNTIGGDVEFGDLSSTSLEKIEVFRGPDSGLYGSDALAGVINLTTRRGTTPLPEFTYAGDGGTFGTSRHEGTIGGAWRKFDYFTSFAHFDTSNSVPNNSFHGATLAGNFGWSPAPGNNLRFTFRRITNDLGLPNEIDAFGIPDDASQKNRDTFVSATFDQQTTAKWHNLLRYGAARLDSKSSNPAPVGIPDSSGFGNFLGLPLTIKGNNGYSVTGQALFYSAECCPQNATSTANRDFVYAQTDYQFSSHLAGLFGYRYEAERGFTLFTSPGFVTNNAADRRNMSFTLETRGDFRNRIFYSLGSGIEKNDVFGVETTPHINLAYYPFRSTSRSWKNTKLKFSFGKGIKEPSIFDQDSSLFNLLRQSPALSPLIQQYNVQPVGAERSRSYDFGIEQALTDRAVINLSLFHNQFTNGTQFVGTGELLALGVPPNVAMQANGTGGATVNTFSFRSQGVEASLEYRVTRALFARAGYTYLDARVEKSFSAAPASNPAFPNIPIGAFAPLIGAPPFRRAPHTGYMAISYNQSRWSALLQGTFVGPRDDSTFLLDDFFGPTLLLPNRNLDAAYQKLDLSGSFRVNPHLRLCASAENFLNQRYDAAFGFPSLPFTIRSGLKITLGGESWRWK